MSILDKIGPYANILWIALIIVVALFVALFIARLIFNGKVRPAAGAPTRAIEDSISTSFGPPIITKCSTLSRRTSTNCL